jgi:microcystin-dependent protein
MKTILRSLAALALFATVPAMSSAFEPFIGEVRMFSGNFAPRGWAFCHGQLLAISSNDALFSILGTTYGGDGRTTFALPDLRGRAPVHAGQGAELPAINPGQKGGGGAASPPSDGATARTTPRMGVNYIIALVGIYPSRN